MSGKLEDAITITILTIAAYHRACCAGGGQYNNTGKKEWTDCVKDGIEMFEIRGDWRDAASESRMFLKKNQNALYDIVAHIQRIGCQPENALHGDQSRSWSAEQGKKKKVGSAPPPPPRAARSL